MTDEHVDGRKNRKSSSRPTTTGKRSAARSEGNRRRYQDPAQREISRQLALKKAAQGKLGRPVGSYDGVRKEERIRINAAAKQKAKETISKMTDKGIISPDDDPRAVAALEAAVEVMNTPANQQTKLAAARLVLDFTKSKPASKSEVTVNKAEEWLAAITNEENDAADEGATEGDAEAPSE